MQVLSSPAGFERTLGSLPEGTRPATRGTLDFALLFARTQAELIKSFPRLRDRLETNGMLWVAWPKKAARSGRSALHQGLKVETDLTESVVREYGLGAGLVDVKICAVDETWSGLKFVRRLRDR